MIRLPKAFTPVRMAHVLGASCVLAGVAFWGYPFFKSDAVAIQVESPAGVAIDPAAQAVAAWLGPGEVRLNVEVLGLIRRQDRAVVVLSVNDAVPTAYLEGEALMPDVTVSSIDANGITLLRAGKTLRIAAPLRPAPDPSGIVRARSARN